MRGAFGALAAGTSPVRRLSSVSSSSTSLQTKPSGHVPLHSGALAKPHSMSPVGVTVGVKVGVWVGVSVGVSVGTSLPDRVGVLVGVWLGIWVDVEVGVEVGTGQHSVPGQKSTSSAKGHAPQGATAPDAQFRVVVQTSLQPASLQVRLPVAQPQKN